MKYKLKVSADYTIIGYGWDKRSAYDSMIEKDPFIRFTDKTFKDLERIITPQQEEYFFKHLPEFSE